ncbi:sigma factor-like helix-turn-helix DNA-binding protein [Desertivirga xinjiangensis]|uniref:sigma factor-like helix-turn-helix DNA-binding protein n=1 Tax=Desertivirga xinjiangensis TaxID=539206 RepID=UPI0034E2BFA4
MRSVENSGYDRLASIDLETQLDAYLENLPKRCREIFFMSRKQMLSNDEIAAKLGISKRSVENQITFALKHLRVSIKDISIALILLSCYKLKKNLAKYLSNDFGSWKEVLLELIPRCLLLFYQTSI